MVGTAVVRAVPQFKLGRKSDQKWPKKVQSRDQGLNEKRREVRMRRKCRGVRVCLGDLLKFQRGRASDRKAQKSGCKA